MTLSIGNMFAVLLGLFGVPLALLWSGRRLRRRSERYRHIFWGALLGHCVAGVIALVAAMVPPEAWSAAETVRGLAGIWGLVALPVVGAMVGAARRSDGGR
jgi:hypothetical protein